MDFRDRAIDLIQSGICDPFDAEKVVGPINPCYTNQNIININRDVMHYGTIT